MATNTHRLANREPDLVETRSGIRVQRQRVAVELGSFERRQPDQLTRPGRLTAGLRDGLARFRADGLRDRLRSLVGQRGCMQQDPHPLVGGSSPPDLRPLRRGGKGGLDIGWTGHADRPDDRAIERRGHLLLTTRHCLDPLATDQQLHAELHPSTLKADRWADERPTGRSSSISVTVLLMSGQEVGRRQKPIIALAFESDVAW